MADENEDDHGPATLSTTVAGGCGRIAVTMTRDVILTLGLLLAAGLVARAVAQLLRVPEVLMLVAAGAVLGPSVLDVLDVPLSSLGAQLAFTLGVSSILFYGGLSLSVDVLRSVWVSLGLLAVAGVALTSVVVALAAMVVFDLSFAEAMLLGAVLSPTDPAILIPLFVGSRLRAKVAQTVVAESALNDPTGAVLALTLAVVVLSGDASVAGPVADFVVELLISTALGLVTGVVLSAVISSRRAGIWRDSAPIAVLAVVAIGYVSLDSAGGSGYLGAFLAGLVVGNMERMGLAMHSEHARDMRVVAATLSDVVTAFVFILVGANLPFGTMADELLPGLAVIAVLVLVARPLTVVVCTAPDRRARWTRRELTFLSWTRETGVIPAALVGVLAGLGVPNVDILASVVALAIVVTLLIQALPAPWLARRLGLLEASGPGAADVIEDPRPMTAAAGTNR
jgi:cell volume regulation protein A